MKKTLVMAVIGFALIIGAPSDSARAGDGWSVYPGPIDREPAPGTGRSLDGVRNGTNREERDRHGGPGEIYLSRRGVPSYYVPFSRCGGLSCEARGRAAFDW
jgi:hypothetical protein